MRPAGTRVAGARVTVVGAGVVGLAAADALRRRGATVRVLDTATPMGARSRGDSRIFRLAHGDPELVEAAARSRPLWRTWDRRAGRALIGDEGAVVSGPRVTAWADAMLAADAGHRVAPTITDPADAGTLPGPVAGPVLHDPAGGVIDVRGVAALLATDVEPATVAAVRDDGTVITDRGEHRADAVVVAAGVGTPRLLAPLGVEVPDDLAHHVRFSFPLRTARTPPCHLDGTPRRVCRAELASTYQHRTHDGHWAVGGHLPDADCAPGRGVEEVTDLWRRVIGEYAAEHLPGVDPAAVEEIACTPTAGLGDGVHTTRVGAVHALWGENLFKLAPLLGEHLAEAVATDDVAHAIGPGRGATDHRR